jgi:aminopeptidase N
MTKRNLFLLAFLVLGGNAFGQYWQQQANYTIDLSLNTNDDSFVGKETILYTNNSNDELTKLFFHLYNNAFQPGSDMDVRSRSLPDPDRRVGDRISKLTKEQEGHLHVKSLSVNGENITATYEENETILEVNLLKPIPPHSVAKVEVEFYGQVPLQIRRSGKDNAEGIEFSMSQWYPKMCEYDEDGWHPNPYIGREFYGIWGDFNVNLTLPANYVVAAGGVLLNEEESFKRVQKAGKNLLTWKYEAKNVHDFVWAADPDYVRTETQVADGPKIYFYHQPGESQPEEKYNDAWDRLPEFTAKAFAMLSKDFGKYPYPVYNVIQGGDGGMEYPMATLITGKRSLPSLVGVTVHEGAHSWYQGMLATDESKYYWMDEGFTSFAATVVMNALFPAQADPYHRESIDGYLELVKAGIEEPLTTHADHFETNYAYGVAAYSKGETYLSQLEYIMGSELFNQTMHTYFNEWSFKHPEPEDILRVAEKESGLVLDWFDEYYVGTTKTLDYAVDTVFASKGETEIVLERKGLFPMPCEVTVSFDNGKECVYYIPLDLMRGMKFRGDMPENWNFQQDWHWVDKTYSLKFKNPNMKVVKVTVDAKNQTIDTDKSNNSYSITK